jgi:sugar lactone lactonase YvrE
MKRIALGLTVTAALAVGVAAATGFPTTGFTIWTIAGNGVACTTSHCGVGGPATRAELFGPNQLAVTKSGALVFSDSGEKRVQEITTGGTLKAIAGSGKACTSGKCGDGGKATNAAFTFPTGVAINSAGDIYVADTDAAVVREINAKTGKISLVAGQLNKPCATPSSCGNGGKATKAKLNDPLGLAISKAGNVYIADRGDQEIREILVKTGIIKDVAGDGTYCASAPSCGDGGSATSATLNSPLAVALDGSGNVYISDGGDNEIRKVSAKSGVITTIAGNGTACATTPSCGDSGPATSAELNFPFGLTVDKSGDVFVADQNDLEVREILPASKQIITVAGNGSACPNTESPCGDGGAAADARIDPPSGVATAPGGGLFVADFVDNRVRWLSGPGVSKSAARLRYMRAALAAHG